MAETAITERQRPARSRAELIAALASARDGIERDKNDLGDLVNVPKRIRKTLSDAPLRRAATALAAGLIGSRFLFGRKRSSEDGDGDGEGRRLGLVRRLLSKIFPELDFRKSFRSLIMSYLEPDQVDLKKLIKKRLKEFLD